MIEAIGDVLRNFGVDSVYAL